MRATLALSGVVLVVLLYLGFTAYVHRGGSRTACSVVPPDAVASALDGPISGGTPVEPEHGAPSGITGCSFARTGDPSAQVVIWFLDGNGDDMYQRQSAASELAHTPLPSGSGEGFTVSGTATAGAFTLRDHRYVNVVTFGSPPSVEAAAAIARAVTIAAA